MTLNIYIKNKVFKKILFFLFIGIGLMACKQSKLEHALQLAGENRTELEKVLQHYSKSKGDELKYKAAKYLIENMEDKYSETALPVDSFNLVIADWMKLLKSGVAEPEKQIDSLWFIHHNLNKVKHYDLEYIKAEYLKKNIEQAFEIWAKPWLKDLEFEQFCEEILPYRIHNEPLEYWRDSIFTQYKGLIDSLMNLPDVNVFEICRIVYKNIDKHWNVHMSVNNYPTMSYSMINKARIGTCREKAFLGIYIMRALGVPVTIESVRTWADRNGGAHMWNTLRFDGKMVSFTVTDAEPDGRYLENRTFAKVYQHSWIGHGNIFNSKDVTEKYTPIRDISLDVNDVAVKYVFLYNSDKFDWNLVCAAPVKNGKVYFDKLGVKAVYLPSYNNEFYGYPFSLSANGEIHHYIPDISQQIEMSLTRTYPLFNNKSIRMKGGLFEGSDKSDFNEVELLYEIEEAPELSFQEVKVNTNKSFRYVRYLSPVNSYGNIAELEFYRDNKKINGKIIGTNGYFPWDYSSKPLPTKDKVFDGDEFTYFDAPEPDNAWVGLDFGKPVSIDKIRYLPKIDNNVVKPLDTYELFYWDGNNEWVSLGSQIASDKTIVFAHAPSNALYLLYNSYQGTARIFTYENGNQVWW